MYIYTYQSQFEVDSIITLIFACEETEELSNLLGVTQPVSGPDSDIGL